MNEELPDGAALVCIPWMDPPTLPGTAMRKCGFCDGAVQVSPEGQQLIREKNAVPVCVTCVAEQADAEQMSTPYAPVIERVEQELGKGSDAMKMHNELPVKELAAQVRDGLRKRGSEN